MDTTTSNQTKSSGFTLIEIMLAIAIMAIVVSISLPVYQGYVKEAEISKVIQEIRQIELLIEDQWQSGGGMPDTLADLGITLTDPWGNPYQYLNLRDSKNHGKSRKDKDLNPINTDFDLYSMGEDGKSISPLTATASHDDIVRANDGNFVGLATDY
ncbi:MAG: prepilin-type N-terminal cleavage/methylation domain-containing protein [Chromatiales bacterium]|jgi:general secretion pathway protein G